MAEQQNTEALMLTRQEESFLIEAEKEQARLPALDALALQEIGLSDEEARIVEVFFLKARSIDFNGLRFSKSECMRCLISCLEYLPRTESNGGGKGTITLESYKQADNIYRNCGQKGEEGKWSDKFRYEFGDALICSHKEKISPLLLKILWKVFRWVEDFQKQHGIFEELPGWLRDGMAGDFSTDNWIGSDLYEGDKTKSSGRRDGDKSQRVEMLAGETVMATPKQKEFLSELAKERGRQVSLGEIASMGKKQASLKISELLEGENREDGKIGENNNCAGSV